MVDVALPTRDRWPEEHWIRTLLRVVSTAPQSAGQVFSAMSEWKETAGMSTLPVARFFRLGKYHLALPDCELSRPLKTGASRAAVLRPYNGGYMEN